MVSRNLNFFSSSNVRWCWLAVQYRFSTHYSRKRFTLRQHVVLLRLKVKKTVTYRDIVDKLIEMPRIRDALNLDSIPAPSTLCKAFDWLEMAVWRVLLNVSLADMLVNGVIGIDASGFGTGLCLHSLHEANESHHPAVDRRRCWSIQRLMPFSTFT